MPGGEPRWQVRPKASCACWSTARPSSNDGELTDARPGRVLRVGNPKAEEDLHRGGAETRRCSEIVRRIAVVLASPCLCGEADRHEGGGLLFEQQARRDRGGRGARSRARRGARRDQGGGALPLGSERHRRHDPLPHAGRARARGRRRVDAVGVGVRCGEGRRHGHRLDALALRPLQPSATPAIRPSAATRRARRTRSRSRSSGKPAFQFANASVFAEYTVVREQGAIPIDPRVPFDRAALIGCGVMTGFGAVVNRAKVETGATMAVFGVGGIGLNCVQGGVLAGASKIIAVDVMPQKLEWAQRFGATHIIDSSKDDPVAAIKDLTGGGADYTLRVRRQRRGHQAGARGARPGRRADHRRRAEGRHDATSSSSTRSTRTSRSSAAATAPRARSATSRCSPTST